MFRAGERGMPTRVFEEDPAPGDWLDPKRRKADPDIQLEGTSGMFFDIVKNS